MDEIVVDPELAAAYRRCFQNHNDGLMVLDHLTEVFGKPPFVQGQTDTTLFNLGAKSVVEHIWTQINRTKD